MGRKPAVVFCALAALALALALGVAAARIWNASAAGHARAVAGFAQLRSIYARADSPARFSELAPVVRALYAKDPALALVVVYHKDAKIAYSLPAKSPFIAAETAWSGHPRYDYDPAVVERHSAPVPIAGMSGWSVDALYVTLGAEDVAAPLRESLLVSLAAFAATLAALALSFAGDRRTRANAAPTSDRDQAASTRTDPRLDPFSGVDDFGSPSASPFDDSPFDIPELARESDSRDSGGPAAAAIELDASDRIPEEELVDPASFERPADDEPARPGYDSSPRHRPEPGQERASLDRAAEYEYDGCFSGPEGSAYGDPDTRLDGGAEAASFRPLPEAVASSGIPARRTSDSSLPPFEPGVFELAEPERHRDKAKPGEAGTTWEVSFGADPDRLALPRERESRSFSDALVDDGDDASIVARGAPREETSVPDETSLAPEGPTGLFSPRSGLGWESYLKERLDHELSRSASFEQDLCLALFECDPASNYGDVYRKLATMLRDFFTFRDLAFEHGKSGFAVILPNTAFEHAMRMAEDFQKKAAFMLRTADGTSFGQTVYIGFSSRAGRLIDAGRIVAEAEKALEKSRDTDTRILGFKPNADRFRDFLRHGAPD